MDDYMDGQMNTAAEAPGDPEEGDIFCCANGEHVGTFETKFLESAETALHFQVLHCGKWYCFQLVSIEQHPKEGEPDVKG